MPLFGKQIDMRWEGEATARKATDRKQSARNGKKTE